MTTLTRSRSPPECVMRLDIFLPVLRRPKRGESPPPERWLGRLARRLAPASWLADRGTGRPGRIRRGLTRLGPTWRSSPVRRFIQAACFALFLGLFFVVCWPYTARPSRVWAGWSTKQADETGQIVLTAAGSAAESPAGMPAPGSSVFLAEAGAVGGPADQSGTIYGRESRRGRNRTHVGNAVDARPTGPAVVRRPLVAVRNAARPMAGALRRRPGGQRVRAGRDLPGPGSVGQHFDGAGRQDLGLVAVAGRRDAGNRHPDSTRLLRLSVPAGNVDRPVRLGGRPARHAIPCAGQRLVGPHQVLPAGRIAGGRAVRGVGDRLCGGDSGDYPRPDVRLDAAASRLAARAASSAAAERRALRIDRPLSAGAGTGAAEASILVQVRLPQRRGLLGRESAPAQRTQGRGQLHPLQSVRRDLPVRCDQGGLHHADQRLHAVPDVRRRVPDAGDQVRRALEPDGLETGWRPADRRDPAGPPRLSVADRRGNGGGHGRRGRDHDHAGVRREPGHAGRRVAGAAAGQRPGTRVSAAVHPLRRMLQSVPEPRAAAAGLPAGTGGPVDPAGGRRLGRLRIQLQRLRSGVSDRRDSGLADRGEKGGANGPGRRQPADLPALRRPRSLPAVCGRVCGGGLSRHRIHAGSQRTGRSGPAGRGLRLPRAGRPGGQVRRLRTVPDALLPDQRQAAGAVGPVGNHRRRRAGQGRPPAPAARTSNSASRSGGRDGHRHRPPGPAPKAICRTS